MKKLQHEKSTAGENMQKKKVQLENSATQKGAI